MDTIIKYLRTAHLEGSRLQKGDEDSSQVPYKKIVGRYIVVEEKLDGANSGVSFGKKLDILLQSRGHFLTGGGRERHFNLFKTWASAHESRLMDILSDQYVMYGEWMYAKHTVFYDNLPHLFFEFDLFDKARGIFLSTAARNEILKDSPVAQVPVLYAGPAPKRIEDLLEMIRQSLGKTDGWRDNLAATARRLDLDVERILRETERSDLSEGLYIKVEEGNETVDRLKYVRKDFLQTMMDNDTHWLDRPIVPNQLAQGVDLYADRLQVTWESLHTPAETIGM